MAGHPRYTKGSPLVPSTAEPAGSAPDFAAGAILGQSRSENFPVASFVLPRRTRSHLLAIYGFARLADDIGDEAEGDRLAQLDWLDAEVERAAVGQATHPLLQRLTPTLAGLRLSLEPFKALIEANRVDQRVTRYETFDDLVGYCQLSAVPVGRLVLAVFDAATPERVALSDDVCVGLQVVEHLQDVAEDAERGRVYLPQSELRAAGVAEGQLTALRATPALRRLVAVQASRAQRLLASGGPLARSLAWQPRAAVAAFAGGGLAALDAVRKARYDVLGHRCRPVKARIGLHVASTLLASGDPVARSASVAA